METKELIQTLRDKAKSAKEKAIQGLSDGIPCDIVLEAANKLEDIEKIAEFYRRELEKVLSERESVVRCKDCKHGQWSKGLGVICEYQQDKIQPFNHFCGSGERIEE